MNDMKGADSATSDRATGLTSVMEGAREIAPDIWWFPSCLEVPIYGRPTHVHNAPYLIIGPDKCVLWDTGDPSAWTDIDRELDARLGTRQLDYLMPSHPEIPHCGNILQLLEKYPDMSVIGDTRDYHLFFPDHADRFEWCPPGTEIDLGDNRVVVQLDAIVKDLPTSRWLYERSEQILFTTDAFAFSHRPPIEDEDRPVHLPSECRLLASELNVEPGPEQIVWITRAALYWARFVKMDVHRAAFDALLERYPTRMLAPAHGSVIDDLALVPLIWQALELAYDPAGGAASAGIQSTDS